MNLIAYGFKRVLEEIQRGHGLIKLLTEEVKRHDPYNVTIATTLVNIENQLKTQTDLLTEIRDRLTALKGNGSVIQSEVHRLVNGQRTGKYEV